MKPVLALDIGGTKIAAADVIDGVCHDRRQLPMPQTEPQFLAAIRELARGRAQPPALAAVAVTGYTDGTSVRAVNRDTIPFWDAYPLVPRLAALLNCPVRAINDAQAAAWAEYRLRRETCRDLLFITLSTGVGGGLVLDGRLRLGPQGLAGHLGHAPVDIAPLDAPQRCGCGRFGCLEAVASGTALARQAAHAFGRPVGGAELFELARDGMAEARAIVELAVQAVASAIAGTQAQLDVQQVVLGGSVGLAVGMLEQVRSALDALPALYRLPIERATLGTDAGLVGAAAWALQEAKR
jgi:N-acylmannosamine kinase